MGAITDFQGNLDRGIYEKNPQKVMHGSGDGQSKPLTSCTQVIGLALFIIACVAAAGHMTGVVSGGCMVGLSIPLIIGGLVMAGIGFAARKPLIGGAALLSVIANIAIMIIGSLAIAGVLPATTAGWAVLGTSLAATVVTCCAAYCVGGAALCGSNETRRSILSQV